MQGFTEIVSLVLVVFAAIVLIGQVNWPYSFISFVKNRKALSVVRKQKADSIALSVLYDVNDSNQCFLMLSGRFLTIGANGRVKFINAYRQPITMKVSDTESVKQLLSLLSGKKITLDYTKNL